MRTAREQWKKYFEGASYQYGRVVVTLEDLKLLGAVPLLGWSAIMTGTDWVVSTAASYENSTVRKLVFEGVEDNAVEVCKGIGQAANMIGSGEAPLKAGSFEIDLGFSLTDSDIKTLRDWASIRDEEGDSPGHWKGIGMSCSGTAVRIYRKYNQASKEEARRGLLKMFRSQEIADVWNSDYKLTGVAWAVQTALTDPQSIVKELHFDITSADKDFEAIGDGIYNALTSGKQLRRDVFSIRVDFKPSLLNGTIAHAVKSANSVTYNVEFEGNRIFVVSGDAVPTLAGELNDRFKDGGDCCVDEWELVFLDRKTNNKGLTEILERATSMDGDKPVTLWLRNTNGQKGCFFVKNRREEELKKALKSICGEPKINKHVRMVTNLRWDDNVADLEDEINALSLPNEISIDGFEGIISFVRGDWRAKALKEAVDLWNGDSGSGTRKDLVKNAFKRRPGDVDWDSVVGDALGSSDNLCVKFREGNLQTQSIDWAAETDSKTGKLILGIVPETALIRGIEKVAERETIHEFALSAQITKDGKDVSPAAFLQDLRRRSWWKNRKCELTFDGDAFMFRNKKAAETPATGGTADTPKVVIGGITAEKRTATDSERKLEAALKKAEATRMPCEGYRFKFLGNTLTRPTIFCYEFINRGGRSGIKPEDALQAASDLSLVEAALRNINLFDASKFENREKKKDAADRKVALERLLGKGFGSFTEEDLKNKKAELEAIAKQLGRDFDLDPCLITDVLNPEAIEGFGKEDLVLRGICFYKGGKYASKVLDDAGVKDTRNYFLHSWLLDTEECRKSKASVTVDAVTRIAGADGIRDKFTGKVTLDDFGENGRRRSVNFHDGDMYSPNNFVFQIGKDGASAWFISEFDPKGDRNFPDGIGKRTIAVHWTFVRDDDGGKYRAEVEKREVYTDRLPCQFSPNEAARMVHNWGTFIKGVRTTTAKDSLKKLKDGERVPQEIWRVLEPNVVFAELSDRKVVIGIDDTGIADAFVKEMAGSFYPGYLPQFAVIGEELARKLNEAWDGKDAHWEKGIDNLFRAVKGNYDAFKKREHSGDPREKRYNRSKKANDRKSLLDSLERTGVVMFDGGFFDDSFTLDAFLERIMRSKKVETLILKSDSKLSVPQKETLVGFLCGVFKGTYGNDVKLESFICMDRDDYRYLSSGVRGEFEGASSDEIAYTVSFDPGAKTLSFKKKDEKKPGDGGGEVWGFHGQEREKAKKEEAERRRKLRNLSCASHTEGVYTITAGESLNDLAMLETAVEYALQQDMRRILLRGACRYDGHLCKECRSKTDAKLRRS